MVNGRKQSYAAFMTGAPPDLASAGRIDHGREPNSIATLCLLVTGWAFHAGAPHWLILVALVSITHCIPSFDLQHSIQGTVLQDALIK